MTKKEVKPTPTQMNLPNQNQKIKKLNSMEKALLIGPETKSPRQQVIRYVSTFDSPLHFSFAFLFWTFQVWILKNPTLFPA
jgi:hypothetical protein